MRHDQRRGASVVVFIRFAFLSRVVATESLGRAVRLVQVYFLRLVDRATSDGDPSLLAGLQAMVGHRPRIDLHVLLVLHLFDDAHLSSRLRIVFMQGIVEFAGLAQLPNERAAVSEVPMVDVPGGRGEGAKDFPFEVFHGKQHVLRASDLTQERRRGRAVPHQRIPEPEGLAAFCEGQMRLQGFHGLWREDVRFGRLVLGGSAQNAKLLRLGHVGILAVAQDVRRQGGRRRPRVVNFR
mmetsp:Transcript_1310/g.3176  ORF Transcript_1310/g.3176 Transcript_1310/m.3176 type:complete len:238 (+) Transcript_1310:258-971(+)